MQYKTSITEFLFILVSACLVEAIQKNTKANVTQSTVKITRYIKPNITKFATTNINKVNKTTSKIENNVTSLKSDNNSFDKIELKHNKLDTVDLLKDTRRSKTHKGRSTSSSSGSDSDDKSSKSGKESLDMTTSSSSSEDFEKRSYKVPKSSLERKGWRKWHRKCDKCEEDMKKKWRDRSIAWICGAYQRARRSFKSECMMHYRNCQDGTMFIKIHDHKCKNDSYHGYHFFYDYKVSLTDQSSSSGSSASSSSESIGDSSGFALDSDDTDEKSSTEKKPKKKVTKFLDVTARVSYA